MSQWNQDLSEVTLEILCSNKFKIFLTLTVASMKIELEPCCCTRVQKSTWPVTGLWNRGPLKWEWVTLVIIRNNFCIIQSLQMSPIPKTGSWSGPYFRHIVEQRGSKGQLISKADWSAIDSLKKPMEEFVLFAFLLFTANKSNSSVHFLGESTARQSAFWSYLIFNGHEKNATS